MTSLVARSTRALRGTGSRLARKPGLLASGVVALTILLANASYLLRIRSNNPMLYHSGLGSPLAGIFSGGYSIDPNDGWTAQALGRLAAESWLHGHIPLWNLFEGLGQPLAGEMQSAALFFPFVLLQLLPNGIFAMHLALELVAGLSTLAFLRTLKLSWIAATCGGCLFAINGAFSVMTNAPFNPIAFLPMTLLGVELIARALQDGRRPRLGIWVTAFALAFMLSSGFPETAYLEGLFVAAWALVRIVELRGHRVRFVVWSIVGAVAGLALAAPALIPFKDFLGFGFTAYHTGGSASAASYPIERLASLTIPYIGGTLGNAMGTPAGYLTLAAATLAIVGLLGRRSKAHLIIMGAFVFLFIGNMYGLPIAKSILDLAPGIKNILVYKYGVALIAFAGAMWAAYGLDDLRSGRTKRWVLVVAAAFATANLVTGVVLLEQNYVGNGHWPTVVMTWTAVLCLVLITILLVGTIRRRRLAILTGIAALLIVLDASATYAVPQLSASPRGAVDLAPIHFLQRNLGTYRFYTLGPIQPNYGSYWGLSELNVNDLPVPKKLSAFILDSLAPPRGTQARYVLRENFIPYEIVPKDPAPEEQAMLLAAYGVQQAAFRSASVKYIVMARGVGTPAVAAKYDLSRVFEDAQTEIWEDAHASPFYTTSGASCTVEDESLTGVTLDCSGPATLLRRELSAPGWSATVNGRSMTVADGSNLFQSIPVPAGRSVISFTYVPAHFLAATALSLGVLAIMVGDACVVLYHRRRRTSETAHDRDPDHLPPQ